MKTNCILRVKYAKGVKRQESANKRRFLRYTRLINWEKAKSAYLGVVYGKDKDYRGKMITFYNDGDYTNKKDFELALKAFLE